MKEIVPDILAITGGVLIGCNIRQLNTISGCIRVFLGLVLIIAGFTLTREKKDEH